MARCILKIFLFVCLTYRLASQDFSFMHYPFDPGFGEIEGNVFYQDHEHRIWVGTSTGLLSFDGMGFHHAQPDNNRHLNITALDEDEAGHIWVGTEEGHVLYGTPFHQDTCEIATGKRVSAIVPSLSGRTCIATYGAGLFFACDSFGRRPGQNILPSEDLYAMIIDEHENLWIASDGGISMINLSRPDQPLSSIHYGNKEGIRDEIIMSLMKTPDGMIWAGAFERGLCTIDSSGQITYPIPAWRFGAIKSLAAVGNIEIWISTELKGVYRYDRTANTVVHVDIPGNETPVIRDMLSDDEGNLWLLDAYRGLYRTNRRFDSYPMELEGIQALRFDHEGQLYAGHPTGLYKIWPGDHKQPEKILDDGNILSLFEDNKMNLWVGTFGQGLYCRPASGKEWYRYTKDNGLTDESILSITGLNDMLWLATLGGVTRIKLDGDPDPYKLNTTNYNLADGLGTNFIYTAMADEQGRVWFGTDGKGLSVLEHGRIQNYVRADSIPLHTIYAITAASSDAIYFVTDRDGVFWFDGITFKQISPVTLHDEEITNILTDPDGNLLLAHTNGIDVLTSSGDILRHEESSGELLSPNLNANCRDATGAIWVAGQRKILRYNTLSTAVRNHPYNILTDVSVFLVPVDFQDKHVLQDKRVFAASENYLTFSFIGLWYTNPEDVTYRYKMVGLDPEWKETHERAVTYQHIPPGAYQFVLESTCSGQYTAPNSISYTFTISKPYYQTAIFLIGVGCALLLVLYGLLRLREKKMERTAALHQQQIESQLQTLKAQINPHFLFNSFNTLVSVIEEDQQAAVEYVEYLSDFYRSILQYREKNLIPLREEIEIVENYAYILRKRYGTALRIQLPVVVPDVWVVPLVLQILVENAVKHNVISERKPLQIDIRMHDTAMIAVENTLQEKPVSEDSTGFGLQSIVGRYALLCDRPVQIGQTPDVFYVRIPVLQKDEISDS